jgi:chorismate dehydratase
MTAPPTAGSHSHSHSHSHCHSSVRLGHITYSNCFPVHARLLDRPEPGDPEIVEGIPSRLNRLLAAGEIDVAPCSSIEFARHAGEYLVLPDLVIGSRGAVRSILLLAERDPRGLGGATVALPTASATSVVLLKILLRLRWGVECRFTDFDQAADDPFATGADAALFIGDVALRPDLHPRLPVRLDLGAEWWEETALPFAFAVWQAVSGDRPALRRLHAALLRSRAFGLAQRQALAARHAHRFGLAPELLADYWGTLSYHLDGPMLRGLEHFYRLAAEIGELERAPALRWVD